MAIPTSGLVLDLRSDTGISLAGSRVIAWADQSGVGNNCTNGTGSEEPYYGLDDNGDPIVMFQSGLNPPEAVANYLDIPAGLALADTRQFTVFFVMQPHITPANGTAVAIQFGSWIYPGLKFIRSSNYHCFANVGNQAPLKSGVRAHLPANKMIVGARTKTTQTDCYLPTGTYTVGTAVPSTTTAGGVLCADASHANPFWGNFYRVLVWNRSLTDVEVADVQTQLTSDYALQSSYSKLAVCVGDSITQGTRTNRNRAWPQRAFPADYLIYNVGYTGKTIGTSSADAGSMWAMRTTMVDPLWQSGYSTKLLLLMGGTNDMAVGRTAAQIWTAIKGYFQDAKAVNAWTTWSLTLPNREDSGTYPPIITDLNVLIRAFNPGTDYVDDIVDAGKGGDSPLARLDDGDNTTYFYTDKTHPIALGSFVIASAVWAKITGSSLAPTTPAAAAGAGANVDVSWVDASTGETGFNIYRRTAASGWTLAGTAAAGATTYTDTGAAGSTSYYYKVTSTDGQESQNDGVVAVTTGVASGSSYYGNSGSMPIGGPSSYYGGK